MPDVNVNENKTPIQVRVSDDKMKAFLIVPRSDTKVRYSAEDAIIALQSKGVVYGIEQDRIQEALFNPVFGREYLVAEGLEVKEGVPGEYEFLFSTKLNHEPKVLPDGSVDYMSIKMIETVGQGDEIAIYHPAVQGKNGVNVLGKMVAAKKVRDLPPLAGKGFTRSEDGQKYTADYSGKIELENGNRITISPVYEVKDDVGIEVGDIDFAGDVIIHGMVTNGATIQAKGNITVEGVVENCVISAFGDVYLLKGVKGGDRTTIRAGGNITAEFIEYADVFAGGDIKADVFFKSNVKCDGIINLSGKRSSVIGGSMAAMEGISCYNVGNKFFVKTDMSVGVTRERAASLDAERKKVQVMEKHLQSIVEGLQKFDAIMEKRGNTDAKSDPRRIQLLRAKIQEEASCMDEKMKLSDMENVFRRGNNARIDVKGKVFPGVTIGINEMNMVMKDEFTSVQFRAGADEIKIEKIEDDGDSK